MTWVERPLQVSTSFPRSAPGWKTETQSSGKPGSQGQSLPIPAPTASAQLPGQPYSQNQPP